MYLLLAPGCQEVDICRCTCSICRNLRRMCIIRSTWVNHACLSRWMHNKISMTSRANTMSNQIDPLAPAMHDIWTLISKRRQHACSNLTLVLSICRRTCNMIFRFVSLQYIYYLSIYLSIYLPISISMYQILAPGCQEVDICRCTCSISGNLRRMCITRNTWVNHACVPLRLDA